MLKGFFYRRPLENESSEFEINIRFEVNSKESVLAKTSNFNSEGFYFTLPRNKIILVPDERILLILDYPEHGQYKIHCEVNYFCNISDPEGNPVVCYGAKFVDISPQVWEKIHDFFAKKEEGEERFFTHIPTSLASIFKPIESSSDISFSGSKPVQPKANPVVPPGIFKESPSHAAKPLETPSNLAKPSETPTKPQATAASPFAFSKAPAAPTPQVFSSKPGNDSGPVFTFSEAPVASAKPSVTSSEPKNQPKSVPVPSQNSIHELAASLASAPTAPGKQKALSLSQEAIDRLVEKLQADEESAQNEPIKNSTASDSEIAPSLNESLNDLWVTENELSAAKTAPDNHPTENQTNGLPIVNDPFGIPGPVATPSVEKPFVPPVEPVNPGLSFSGLFSKKAVNTPRATGSSPELSAPVEPRESVPKPEINLGIFKNKMAPQNTSVPPGPSATIPNKKPGDSRIPSIKPNNSQAKMDQKSIDKLVQTLLQDIDDEPQTGNSAPKVPDHPLAQNEPTVTPISEPISTGESFNSRNHFNPGPMAAANQGIAPNILSKNHSSTRVMDQKSIDKIVQALTHNNELSNGPYNANPSVNVPVSPSYSSFSDSRRTLDQRTMGQAVQSLNQNIASHGTPVMVAREQKNTNASDAFTVTMQLEKGEIVYGVIEQAYVGGLMIRLENELFIHSSVKITIINGTVHIVDLQGTCTNCEPAIAGKYYLAEIFFKSLTSAQIDQFHSLISRLNKN